MTNYDILKEYEAHKTPVPTYDEYKAMQLRIENEKRLLDYNGELLNRLKETEETVKSLFQQIAGSSKTIEEMKEKLAEHRRYCCCSENEVMRLKLAEMEELLKECKKYIDFCCVPDGFGKSYIAEDLLTRIKAALGESEDDIERLYK
nr:MAG TPA: Septin family protein [Caudoviricetes sp.]